jgi:prepilin peptidase CpaA
MVAVAVAACIPQACRGRALPHAIDLFSVSVADMIAIPIYVFLLVMAALSDLCSLRIPNWLTGSLALAFPIVALLLLRHPVDWLSHLAAGFGVFAVAAALFFLRLIGGGDAKLLAATALWIGLGQIPSFLILVSLMGGVFALVVLLLRHPFTQTMLLATLRRLPTVTQRDMPVPYGVPIALAGILMIPALPLFG